MRILHLNNEKTWRGGERQTLLLAAALRDRVVESVIGCRPGGPLEQKARAASVKTLAIPGNNFGAAIALTRAARDFDLIHCHTGRGHSLAAVTSLLHRTPFVVTRRVDFLPGSGWFNRYKFRRAVRVICISKFIADQLAGWGVPRNKLPVIPSTVPQPAAELLKAEHRSAARTRLGIKGNTRLVGNIAAMVGHKDHATLLRAAKLLTDRRPDVRFVILGDGELKNQLLAQRRELDIEEKVLMPGFIPQAEEFLPAFDVFAMSSCMEGLGSIVLDAFAAGVPVAATAGGGLPELVRTGQTGVLSPVGDATALAQGIERLLDEPELRENLCANAKKFVTQEFSVDRMAENYHFIYKSIVK